MAFDWRHAAQLPINIGGGQTPTQRHFNKLHGPLWIAACGIHDKSGPGWTSFPTKTFQTSNAASAPTPG